MEIFIGIVEKIAEYTVEPIGRQMGYLFLYNNNVNELKNHVEKLGDAKQRVQQSVGEAEMNGNTIFEDVKKWLTRVDEITTEVDKLIEDLSQAKMNCSNWSSLNLKSRHQSSRKANKMAQVVSKLEGECRSFDGRDVSYRVPPQGIGTKAIKGYEVFESRMSTLSKVIEALKSDNVNKIGVYGMGGVGKTMLVKEVARQAKQDKLFDKAVMTVASQTPDFKKMQGDIADMLGLKFNEESINGRAEKLCEKLKTEKKILVIIDDIWEKLDLEDLGISFGDNQKGCKLLFTSRSEDVLCNDMDCQKVFSLGVLSYEEARYLFGKNVGNLAEHTDFHPIAVDVVKECAGLPIAITTIANALKNKSLPVWKDVVHQLRTSNPTNIKGLHKKVYLSIELSYNYLISEEAKSLFLLCSLFGEDNNIDVEFLLRDGMGLNLFQGVYHLEDVRNRVHTLVENLKSSSLLLDGDKDDTVKMHDVIRDVAIHIAGKSKHIFIVENAVKLQELSKQEKLKDSTALLMLYTDEDVCEFLGRLECSQLMLFLLFKNTRSLQIPHPFFEGTKELQVLNLFGIDSQYFPSSLCCLKNLQTLYLNDCELENIAFIGELKNLKVLSLSNSEIRELPKEISQLTNLQVLDLSYCSKLKIIPANVLSNLKRLEELNMESSFTSWKVSGESTEGSIAKVTELDHLSHLTSLNISIPNANFDLPKALTFEKLERYEIFIGDEHRQSYDSKNSRTLKLQLNKSLQLEHLDAVKMLFKSCEDLYLGELGGIQNIFYTLSSDGFPCLKYLQVDNAEMQYIIKGLHCVAFPFLESFSLYFAIKLEKICHGQLAVESFHNLRNVEVKECHNLKFVFSSSMAGCFPQLQKISIIDCKVMSTIIVMEREDETEIIDDTKNMMEFTQLQSLTLKHLPNLMCFRSDVDSRLLFNEKVSFQNLTTLTVESCDSLKCLLSSSTARSLVRLQHLMIYKCNDLEEILVTEESGEEKRTENILFRKLESLNLQDLPKLMMGFCVEYLIEFPSLKDLRITNCPELRTFVSNSLSTNLTVNKELEEMNNCATQSLFNEKVSFQNLTTLTVGSCDSLKCLLSSSTARSLVRLQKLMIYKCKDLEEILVTEESGEEKRTENILFRKLESLNLQDLPNLIMGFCIEYIIEFSSLKDLRITNCPELRIFVSNSLSTNLTVNKKLLDTEESGEEKRTESILFRKLESLNLVDLPKLVMGFCCEYLIEFPSLKDMKIINCPELKTFVSNSLSTNLAVNKELEEMNNCATQSLFNEKVLVPNLLKMEINGTDNLRMIWHDKIAIDSFCKLKEMNVTKCKNLMNIFPSTMQRRLQSLVTLEVTDCDLVEEVFEIRGANVNEAGIIVAELRSLCLKNLATLKHVWNMNPQGIHFQNLQTVTVKDCRSLKSLFPASMTKHLTQLESLQIFDCGVEDIVAKEEGFEIEPKFVFPLLNSLELQNLHVLKSFHVGKHTLEWPSLKKLEIENCGKMKIFASDSLSFEETCGVDHHGVPFEQPLFLIEKASFPELEELTLKGYFDMNETWHGHIPTEFFSKLKVLELNGFHDKAIVFSYGFLQRLYNLEELRVENSQFREIFRFEELGVEKHGVTLARFKNLYLCRLPELVHLQKEDSQAHPFFQNLETLVINECDKLKNLVSSPISFQNLTRLSVWCCNGLFNLITFSTAKSLVQLMKMEILDCKNITEIVANERVEAGDDEILFSHLRYLELYDLPSLTSFYLGNCNIKFPSLEKVIVKGCPKLKIFSHGMLSTPKLQRVHLVKNCGDLSKMDHVFDTQSKKLGGVDLNTTVQRFWEDYLNKSTEQSFTNQKNGVDPMGRSVKKARTVEDVADGTKPWQLSKIVEAVQCRLATMPDSTDTFSKVVRLLYTNSGTGVLALGSNGVQKLWKWTSNEQNPSGKATASVIPQHWQPNSGLRMSNDVSGVNLEEAVPCIALSKNDKYVISACGGKVSLFNMMTFKIMTKFMSTATPASTFLAFHPQDNNIVAIGMEDSTIHIYNLRALLDEVKSKLKGHQKQITGLAFSTTLDILVSSGADAQLCVWGIDTWEKRKSVTIQIPAGKAPLGDTRVQFHADQIRLLVVHETQLAIYDALKMDQIRQWVPQDILPAPISYATYSCNSQLIYATFCDGNIGVFDADSLTLRCRIAPSVYLSQAALNRSQALYPLVVAAHPLDPNQIAIGLSDGSVKVLEPTETEGKWGSTPPMDNGILNGRTASSSTTTSNHTPDQTQR